MGNGGYPPNPYHQYYPPQPYQNPHPAPSLPYYQLPYGYSYAFQFIYHAPQTNSNPPFATQTNPHAPQPNPKTTNFPGSTAYPSITNVPAPHSNPTVIPLLNVDTTVTGIIFLPHIA